MTRIRTFSRVEEHRAREHARLRVFSAKRSMHLKCEFRSCSKCCKGENGKQCDGHDLRSRSKKKNEQAEQKQNENEVNEIGLQNEEPSGKKDPEESTRDGKKAHDFDVFCEPFGVVVAMSKEEKENKIKETEMFVRFVLKNDENNKER